jgi:hypothetical protein
MNLIDRHKCSIGRSNHGQRYASAWILVTPRSVPLSTTTKRLPPSSATRFLIIVYAQLTELGIPACSPQIDPTGRINVHPFAISGVILRTLLLSGVGTGAAAHPATNTKARTIKSKRLIDFTRFMRFTGFIDFPRFIDCIRFIGFPRLNCDSPYDHSHLRPKGKAPCHQ